MLLGSEVVIMPIDDARKLVKIFLESRSDIERLQRLGILDILENLRSAVRRYDYDLEDDY